MQALQRCKTALETRVYIRDWSSSMFALFPAQLSEVDACYDLIDQGREFQRKQGSSSGRPTILSANMLPPTLKLAEAMHSRTNPVMSQVTFASTSAVNLLTIQSRDNGAPRSRAAFCTVWLSVPTIADRGWAAYFCVNVNGSVKKGRNLPARRHESGQHTYAACL